MSYKSLTTIWDGQDDSRATLQTALKIAREYDAHLKVLCVGYDVSQPGFSYVDISALMLNENIAAARKQAESLAKEATGMLEIEDVIWSVQTGTSQVSGLSSLIGNAVRFNDLVIFPQPYRPEDNNKTAVLIEAALFEGGAPVLVNPPENLDTLGEKIVVAWNGSREALNAIRASLPFLKSADLVDLVIIDPGRREHNQADPGADISKMLSRHGVKVEVSLLPRSTAKISEILKQRVIETGADLLVMGAYGHSRFRESILGGATRNTLENATVPVLMAH